MHSHMYRGVGGARARRAVSLYGDAVAAIKSIILINERVQSTPLPSLTQPAAPQFACTFT